MQFQKFDKLLRLWSTALSKGANVVLMRHAPKAGGDSSDLSEEGKHLAKMYCENVLQTLLFKYGLPTLFCTSKYRTQQTLKILFPSSRECFKNLDLEVNKVTPFVQRQVDKLHKEVGRFRGYFLNHTYYFLENLGGQFDEENLYTVVAGRMARGIKSLFYCEGFTVYCGHSPAIEVGLEELLNISLPELGGFLNPLDSIHLRMVDGQIEFAARINPILDYADLESERYFDEI